MKGMITVAEMAEKWGISPRYVQHLCKQGRIEGAVKFGNTWAIPEHAKKPDNVKSAMK
ncbi:helix-turn-helix domain-containing protein [Clostridium sp. SYSU_GA19001]|uniref:helix-turn-helix domain-containing protein n=1 Tax=Clostridium caldaquaticum TaxID=2940653 RepID=UPI0020770AE3|nr:helix-turn-helix domain-containing protein [Clostridium caldaquaticum]MCM8710884.1 helix-turn-helix domain-containing protein [Clostridium caldaquaticum]